MESDIDEGDHTRPSLEDVKPVPRIAVMRRVAARPLHLRYNEESIDSVKQKRDEYDRPLQNSHKGQVSEDRDDRVELGPAAQAVGVRNQVLNHEEPDRKQPGQGHQFMQHKRVAEPRPAAWLTLFD